MYRETEQGLPRWPLIILAILLAILGIAPDRLFAAKPKHALPVTTLHVTRLRCEYRKNPLGVDRVNLKMDWQLQTTDPAARGITQTAYQIVVASTPTLLRQDKGNQWNTGWVKSSETSDIEYAGRRLLSDQEYWWKVRVRDQTGHPTAWSKVGRWTMGVLSVRDWHGAQWIGAPLSLQGDDNSTEIMRDSFTVKSGLKSASVNICGLGQYEMSLNGTKVGDDLLAPGWTAYKKTCLYDTYNITRQLHPGRNAVGLLLGNGMYRIGGGRRYHKIQDDFGPLQAIALIHLQYKNGSVRNIVSNGQWRAGVSPMTFSSVYGGEDWDAQLVQKGWNEPDFNQSRWLPVQILPGPGGTLKGLTHAAPPIKAFQIVKPISQKQIKPNVTVYDLGQTASYMERFTVHGPVGSMVRITPDELVMPDGSLFYNNYNGRSYSQYTLSGRGPETYTAKFFYDGCRYFQVQCFPAPGGSIVPKVDSIKGIVVHSSSTPVGSFSCSNMLFNRIFTMIKWAEVSNMMSVITDCPNRERLGWLEQDHLHGPSFRYNFNMSPLVAKVISDMSDSQQPDGLIPTTAPEYIQTSGVWREAIEWGSAGVLLPWQQYQWTGDLNGLRRNYPMMERYTQYLTSTAHDGIAANGLGDWSGQHASPATPKSLVATALYYRDVTVLARTAKLLGYSAKAHSADQLAETILAAFNAKFFHPGTNEYGPGSQCSNAMPLVFGMVPAAKRIAVLNNIVADLKTRNYQLTVGEVGLEYLFQALSEGGRSDVIYAINNQSKQPGYGYMLKKGATALCETWDDNRDNTQDQFMLGHIIEWFYHGLAGIQLDPDHPGFQQFVIHPSVVGNLTHVQASYESIKGEIVGDWTRTPSQLQLSIVVPPNTMAIVYIPSSGGGKITESGRPLRRARDVVIMKTTPDGTVCAVRSGHYSFAAPFLSEKE